MAAFLRISSTKIRTLVFLAALFAGLTATEITCYAEIWPPEGLNMPGAWNGWQNPPANLALASATQVPGGRVVRITAGTQRYQTVFSVAPTGGDIVGGTYEWLFTSGPSGSPWNNKWASVNVTMNTLQSYTFNSGPNNTITVTDGKWYTMNWQDNNYTATQAIFMETSAQPVSIATVSVPSNVYTGVPAVITVTASQVPCAEELFYIRYTTDGWSTSTAVAVNMAGASGTATIPGFPASTVVSYYAFSSTVGSVSANYDMLTIKLNNNGGTNYSYMVSDPSPVITWANLQWPASGEITLGNAFNVYGQALIPGQTGGTPPAAGLQAWIGYSTANTDPSTWTDWIPAPYNAPAGFNDEFKGDLGTAITLTGTYYYATRFRLNADPYVYGGFSASGGGFWDGTNNVSGVLTVISTPVITFASLDGPASGTIELGQQFQVTGKVEIPGITGGPAPTPGLEAWVGYSLNNSDPALWNDWFSVIRLAPDSFFDVFLSDLGAEIPGTGTFYYAYRYRYNGGAYVYGGYSATGGGFWNGSTNVSGTLTVNPPPTIVWANLQWPPSGEITLGGDFDVYGQVYIPGLTGGTLPAAGLLAWIGYSTDNTDPSTWTNWVAAPYSGAVGNNDEFKGNPGAAIPTAGTWYYACRYSYNGGAYVYGGYSASGGGFWDGTGNVSGVLTVNSPPAVITFANLDNPPVGTIELGQQYQVRGKVEIPGITGGPTPTPGLEAWVGFSLTNSNPATWTDWVDATWLMPDSFFDIFLCNLGTGITETGNFYYATRYRYNGGAYVYGGYSDTGGGFWDGVTNISGLLTVNPAVPDFRNLENITVHPRESVCYDAKQVITVGGGGGYFIVEPDGEVIMVAGRSIDFLPDVTVSEGAYLHAYITQSAAWCYTLVRKELKIADAPETPVIPADRMSLRIFPNPSHGELFVEIKGLADDASSRLELYGISGNLLGTRSLDGSGRFALSLTGMPSGVYVVRVISSDQVQTKMIIKQ